MNALAPRRAWVAALVAETPTLAGVRVGMYDDAGRVTKEMTPAEVIIPRGASGLRPACTSS